MRYVYRKGDEVCVLEMREGMIPPPSVPFVVRGNDGAYGVLSYEGEIGYDESPVPKRSKKPS